MKAIVNTKLITEHGIIWDGAVLWDGDTVIASGAQAGKKIISPDLYPETEIPDVAEIIDAGGLYTAPGLIDIHNHGSETVRFADDPLSCAEHFLVHGETTVLPTMYHNLNMKEMLDAADRIDAVKDHGIGRTMRYGMYMEGPFMHLSGCFMSQLAWSEELKEEEYRTLIDGIGRRAAVYAIDPAREHIEDVMQYARSVNPDVIFAYGHSNASTAQCRRLRKYGCRVHTHHADAGQGPSRCRGVPGAGCDEYSLIEPELYSELIMDVNGIHVVPDLAKAILRCKGPEHIILITDSMPSSGNHKNCDAVAYGPDLNYDDKGHLAGSHLTLEHACRNLMAHTPYGLVHAINMATVNPARMLGLEDKIGSLNPSCKANIILIDDMVNVDRVFLEGELAVKDGVCVMERA